MLLLKFDFGLVNLNQIIYYFKLKLLNDLNLVIKELNYEIQSYYHHILYDSLIQLIFANVSLIKSNNKNFNYQFMNNN